MSIAATSLDALDRKILAALQDEGRLSNIDLSERIGLSASQCSRRLKRLEDEGVIARYAAILEAARLGIGVTAFVTVTLERQREDAAQAFQAAVAERPAIQECWAISGDGDYLLRVVAADLKSFSDFMMHDLLALPNVANVRSAIALDRLKQTTALPL